MVVDKGSDTPNELITWGLSRSQGAQDKARAEDPDCGALLGTHHESHTLSYRRFHFSRFQN